MTGIKDIDEYIMKFLRGFEEPYTCDLVMNNNLWDLDDAFGEAGRTELTDSIWCMATNPELEYMIDMFHHHYTDFDVFIVAIQAGNRFLVEEYYYRVNHQERLVGALAAIEAERRCLAHWLFE